MENEGWRVRRDGSTFYADVILTAIRGEGGSLVGFAKITRDVTERKRLQDELRAHQENLESIVQQRTEDLKVAKEAAEAASRAKSAFLSMVSHELRTPMNGIMGTLALARRQTSDAGLLDYLGKADRSAKQLLGIINDVLDIARIEADRLTIASTPFLAGEILAHVRDNLEDLARSKGLDFSFVLPDALRQQGFIGDPTRITQVLINIVGNALKFTKSGYVRVRLETRKNSEHVSVLRFEVEDTGIGIRQEDTARIFNSFEQVDATATRQYGGTGLGLALAKALTEAMGGRIGVVSRLGIGSTFWFEILVGECAAPGEHDESLQAERLRKTLLERHGRILLVEDEPLTREIGQTLLLDAGLEVETAQDGQEAVQAAGTGAFDMILMDMNMPRMGGLEAALCIRNMQSHQHTPIIALTANAFAEDRDRCIRAGMNDFMTKPFTPEVLYQVVLRWLTEVHEA